MSAEEARWQVRFASGEVKVLTLDQVDDLFRRDMIDEDTLLRQGGTEQWLPLRVVAGLDDEEAAPPAPPPVVRSAPPPPPPPPPPPRPPPSQRAPFAPSPSFVPPAPMSARPPSFSPPAAPAPMVSFAPPFVAAAGHASFAPPWPPPRANRAEPLLIGLAALLGLLVALYRNGVMAALFASAGQSAAYEGMEAKLGGPGTGTLRAVDALVAKTPVLAGAAAAPNAKR